MALRQARFLILPAAAAGLWCASVPGIRPGAMNDLGLVSVLPWQAWLAYALLTAGFIVCWRRADRAVPLLLVHVLLLVVMLYGLPAAITHEPSGPIVYRHAGITENLIRTRIVNTKLDAYFSWPGFFMGLATLVKLAGVKSALSFGTWATVAFNLLFLPPLLLVARALTRDQRLIWGTVWLFYTANWIHQDYLAPQAFAYLLFLTILGLLLTYLPARVTGEGGRAERRIRALLRVRPAPDALPGVSGWTAAAVVALVVVLYTATVSSHQLTPFAILLAVMALVVLGRCTARGLPLLMAVMLVLWTGFVADGYISGHLLHVISGFGDVSQATAVNVTARFSGSPEHLLVIRDRLVLSGGMALLALAGAIRRFRAGYADHGPAALGLVPVLLFAMQAYGGEMLMRVYFFMLPFLAFFAAAAFLPRVAPPTAERRRLAGPLGRLVHFQAGRFPVRASLAAVSFPLIAVLLLSGTLLARYGNERVDYFFRDEIAATRFLYSQAPPGSTFAVERPYLPWKFQGYEQHKYVSLVSMLSQPHPPAPARALHLLTQELRPAAGRPAGFVIVTHSQRVYSEMLGGVPSPAYLSTFGRLLRESPSFRLIYASPHARIYVCLPE